MTYKVTTSQIENMFDQLPIEDRLDLVRRLEKKTWAKRLQQCFNRIDAKRKKSKMTRKEIWDEVKKARAEFYARHS